MLADIAKCTVAQTYVLIDQTQKQCAEEHDCSPDTKCPLDGCFVEDNFFEEPVDSSRK